ncbi:hypothetical protein [Streptomyces sp. TLI_185]|uniref:hypothetical protein n=1 Tax=Streptomyces sp. TLI_185 TaxID=2485151 RepID=UPI000FB670FA|nr:hypothetical protein [Streptomyces sp. TLI_185]RPF33145.1 hypothetical protein EDD92_3048 [Streptomyces sp. TLI_185]
MGVLFGAAGLLVLPLLLAVDMYWLATTRAAAVAVYLALFTVFLAYRLFGHGAHAGVGGHVVDAGGAGRGGGPGRHRAR